jgi:AhpD family alkylhydroperoxidase
MQTFPLHSLESAPAASTQALRFLEQTFGFVPNVASAMATSPVLLKSLVGLFQNVHGGSFSEAELQIILLTNAVTNRCEWATAFHSALARMQGILPEDVAAIRAGGQPGQPALAVLSRLARMLIEQRGHLTQEAMDQFVADGLTPAKVLEVVAVVAASTITNYTASIARPALEPQFESQAWKAPA